MSRAGRKKAARREDPPAMSLPIDERQPIPSVRTVATLINGGAVYAPSASPLKAGAGVQDVGDQNDLLAQMVACAQACA
jgi:hypothetical protein